MSISAQLQSAASLQSSGDLNGAARIYQRILEQQPEQVDALRLLGLVHASRGQFDQACELMEKVVNVKPSFAAGHSSLGLLLAEMGMVDEAISACQRALHLDQGQAGAHCGLGLALKKKGELDGAIESFREAIRLNPNAAMAHSNLAPLLATKGDLPGSIHSYRKVCHLQPNRKRAVLQLASALRTVCFSQLDERLKGDLLNCFSTDGVNYRDLATATASALKLDPAIASMIEAYGTPGSHLPENFFSDSNVGVLNDRLLLKLLQNCAVQDRELERLLTKIRAHILARALEGDEVADAELRLLSPFICSLARQCFFNEYIYALSDNETAALHRIEARLEQISDVLDAKDKIYIALYGCYQPLHTVTVAGKILNAGAGDSDTLFNDLLIDQISNPLTELEYRSKLPSLVTHTDGITASVQAQYEENPFPRWKDCIARAAGDFAAEIGNILPHVHLSPDLNLQAPEILIAGCGTGWQAVNCSHTYKNARITAIDLSLTSLAYARRMTEELGVNNIEYLHGNILELDNLDKRFDLIECGGVLHHLSEPYRGWEILTGLMKEGGLMMLGLYSEIARKAVVRCRQFVAERGYPPTIEGIRLCRQDLFETEDALLQEDIICTGSPFWTTSEVRDLIFHEMEHRYSIPELAGTIRRLDLEFLGFQHQDAAQMMRYVSCFPDDPNGLDLDNWHEYEQMHPRTFTNMYLFWLRK